MVVDNDVEVFLDGTLLNPGLQINDFCPNTRPPDTFTIAASLLTAGT